MSVMIDRNCLAYWFPILQSAIPASVPKTRIISSCGVALHKLLDGDAPPGFGAFISELRQAAEWLNYPCFLRTGHTSDKHSWKRTCYVTRHEDFPQHIFNLVEFSECAGIMGLPYDTWAVREFLPGPVLGTCTQYGDMPVRMEFRYFVRDGKIICHHNYWPSEALRRGGAVALAIRQNEEAAPESWPNLDTLITRAAASFDGYWSMDALWTDRGWFITDMARGEDSWHWPECAKALLKQGDD